MIETGTEAARPQDRKLQIIVNKEINSEEKINCKRGSTSKPTNKI